MRNSGLDFSRLRILLIENNHMMRRLVREMLVGFGASTANVIETDNVDDAIRSVYNSKFDIVICDFSLGDLDGGDLIRHIRGDASCPNRKIPILLITGSPSNDKVSKALNSGVNEVLAKPLSPKILHFRLVSMITRPRPFVITSKYVGPARGLQRQEAMTRLLAMLQPGQSRKFRNISSKVLRFREHSQPGENSDELYF